MTPRGQIEREIRAVREGSLAGGRPPFAGGDRPWRGSRVQVLLFDTIRWTERQAKSWARQHGFGTRKVHRTEHYVRIRQFDPTPGRPKRTIAFGRDPDLGIRAVVEASV